MNISVNLSSQIKAAKDKKVLNKPFRTPDGPKKFAVYVKNENGNIVKVRFGDPNMEIKRDNPERRKSFRARHKCDTNPGPRWKARYWSCKMWENKKVENVSKGSAEEVVHQWDGLTYWEENDLLSIQPALANAEEVVEDAEDLTEDMIEEAYDMIIGQFAYISDSSKEVLSKLRSDPKLASRLELWVQNKATIIEDYLASVYDFIMAPEGEVEIDEDVEIKAGARILNVNASCEHFGSEGIVKNIELLPDSMGQVVVYEVINNGKNFKKGDILKKTFDQLQTLDAAQNSPREGIKRNWNIRYKKF